MIRLTFVTNHFRSGVEEYDTDSLKEALLADVEAHFKDPENGADGVSNGPERWVFAYVIERGDARYTPGEQADAFRDIAEIECYRATTR
jgi:hypothetical protein